MALLSIVKAPHPVLKKPCQAVESVGDDIRTLIDDMLETMYAAPGMGLAAPQVGILKRVIVVDVTKPDGPRAPVRMVDPFLIEASKETAAYEEGAVGAMRPPTELVGLYLDGAATLPHGTAMFCGIAVDDTCLARDLRMGREWGCHGEKKKHKVQEHGLMMAFSEWHRK